MNRTIEISTNEGLLRLEAVAPGIIRCVRTLQERVAEPSALVERSAWTQTPWEAQEDTSCVRLCSGELCACYDKNNDKLTWSSDHLLLQEGVHELAEQDVIRYDTGGEAPIIDRVKTVDGERNFIRNLRPVIDRRAYRAKLNFEFAPDEGIYGLGQGEEGVWNYRHQNQYLYQHNMRIPKIGRAHV